MTRSAVRPAGLALADVRLPRPRLWPRNGLVLEAAVAVVLRGTTLADAELLLMRRAAKAGDPWSGDMAFPGGRRAPSDRDLTVTAMRETLEEVGLALEGNSVSLGRLRQVVTFAPSGSRRMRPMIVSPFVFAWTASEAPRLTPGHEVADTRWIPLTMFIGPTHRARRTWRVLGIPWPAPAWRIDGDIVWGLTHQMIRHLLTALG